MSNHINKSQFGTNGDDTIDGTDVSDIINGKNGDDNISAGAGDDFIRGGSGQDTIDAEAGNDLIFGGLGRDNISGGDGHDLILGGRDQDTINAGSGYDYVNAGRGDDIVTHIVSENVNTKDFYVGGRDQDTLQLAFTTAKWSQPDVQADIAAFRTFLNEGQNSDFFYFLSLGVTVTQFENLDVIVDDVELNPEDDVTARDDMFTFNDNGILDVSEASAKTGSSGNFSLVDDDGSLKFENTVSTDLQESDFIFI